MRACDASLAGTRVAWSATLGFAPVENETREICAAAARAFADIGAKVEDASPDIGNPAWILRTLYGGAQAGAHAARPPAEKVQMDPALIAYAEASAGLTVVEYLKAVAARQAMVDTLGRFFERYDLLLTPTLCLPAFPLGLVGPRSKVAGREVTPRMEARSAIRSTTAGNRPSWCPRGGRQVACPSDCRSLAAGGRDALVLTRGGGVRGGPPLGGAPAGGARRKSRGWRSSRAGIQSPTAMIGSP